MSRLTGIRARMQSLLRGSAAASRSDEEFEFHIDKQTQKHIARGLDPQEARRLALLEFGAVDGHREEMRDVRRPRLLAELQQDLAFTLRSLRSAPSFALTAVLVIALGIGATTALFSIANALLFRPLPVAQPGDLYMLQESRSAGPQSTGPEGRRIPYSRYEAYRENTAGIIDGLAAHAFRAFAFRTDDGAQSVSGAVTSDNYFAVLGVAPALGRFYADLDEPSAVISHRFWRSHFNEDSNVIGATVHLDGVPYTVVGVAAEGFHGTSIGLLNSVWVPYGALRAVDSTAASQRLGMIARVSNRVAGAGTESQLTTIGQQIPGETQSVQVDRVYLLPLSGLPEGARAGALGFMGMLMVAALLVLLIAAANIASLLMARTVMRQREIGLRLALGAGRARLIRQLLTESSVLFLVGGAGGILLAWIATAILAGITIIPGTPFALHATPDLRVLTFALVLAATTGLVFGMAPALRATAHNVANAMRDGAGKGATPRLRGRSVFVATQIAFATVLLISAGLFVRGLQLGVSTDPGFRSDGVVVGSMDLERMGPERGRVLQDQLIARIRALPGVESASLASVVLATGSQHSTGVRSSAAETSSTTSGMSVVDAEYFRTLGIRILRGRAFTPVDNESAPRVVIVNETLAERFWPDEDPIGRQLHRAGEAYEVIGLTPNGRYVEPNEEPQPFMFFSAAQEYSPQISVHVRSGVEPAAMIHAIRNELRAVDPDVALELAMPLNNMMGLSLLPLRFAAGLIGSFGLLGLLLAAAGVYGVMAYQVAQRSREFGVRLALGARAQDLLRLVVGRSALIAGSGAIAGILMAAAVTRLLTSLLFGLSPLDPVTYGAVAVTLAAVTVSASWIPARRALQSDPVVSLRHD